MNARLSFRAGTLPKQEWTRMPERAPPLPGRDAAAETGAVPHA